MPIQLSSLMHRNLAQPRRVDRCAPFPIRAWSFRNNIIAKPIWPIKTIGPSSRIWKKSICRNLGASILAPWPLSTITIIPFNSNIWPGIFLKTGKHDNNLPGFATDSWEAPAFPLMFIVISRKVRRREQRKAFQANDRLDVRISNRTATEVAVHLAGIASYRRPFLPASAPVDLSTDIVAVKYALPIGLLLRTRFTLRPIQFVDVASCLFFIWHQVGVFVRQRTVRAGSRNCPEILTE